MSIEIQGVSDSSVEVSSHVILKLDSDRHFPLFQRIVLDYLLIAAIVPT